MQLLTLVKALFHSADSEFLISTDLKVMHVIVLLITSVLVYCNKTQRARKPLYISSS